MKSGTTGRDAGLGYQPVFISEPAVYPRSVSGKYSRLRWLVVVLTQLVFYGLPWIQWGSRQAVLFDLDARRFYVFGLVLFPQDFIYLAVLLILCALSLFVVTAMAGRVWCGYGCPQTVYTEIFLWIERKIEGDRQRRLKLDASPWSPKKLGLKGAKHLVWIAVAFWTGLTFVAYFTPIRQLLPAIFGFGLGPWELFWVGFYGFATYGNAGFMREQVCKYMCPYARFQGAMFDKDSLIITYDIERGEPRGAKRLRDAKAKPFGDCVDCSLCVQVCPTGIDIRKGLQYECIGCAACIDVCNGVMKKLDFAPGLIRYSTQSGLENKWDARRILHRMFRPRVLVYLALLLLIGGAWIFSLSHRHDFKVDVVRDRGVLARIVAGGSIENIYRIQLMNASNDAQRLDIAAGGLNGLRVVGAHEFVLPAGEARWFVLRVDLPRDQSRVGSSGSHPIEFSIRNVLTDEVLREKSVFYIPR